MAGQQEPQRQAGPATRERQEQKGAFPHPPAAAPRLALVVHGQGEAEAGQDADRDGGGQAHVGIHAGAAGDRNKAFLPAPGSAAVRLRLAAALLLLLVPLAGCLSGGDGRADGGTPAAGAASLLSAVRFSTRLRETFDIPSAADGVPLRVDVYRPEGEGPFPAILVLSPYWAFLGDAKASESPTWYIDYFVPRGYAVALGEMRGTRDSGGCWDFGGPLDQRDGHDIVEGIAALPWSNGKVGMLGQSHVGMSQLATAITDPPHLTTIVPIAAVSDWYRYLHKDGAPYVVNRGTPPAYFAVHASPSTPPTGGEGATPGWALTQAQTLCEDNAVHLSQSAELDGDKDAYWQERDLIAGAGNVRASVFMVHGFRDENVKTDHFLDFWNGLPAGVERKAWFGQWGHEHPFFEEWRTDLHQWYDYWLLGIDNGILDEPRVVVQDGLAWDDGLGYDPMARNATAWPIVARTEAWMLDGATLVPEAAGTATGSASYVAVPGDDRPGPHLSQPYEVAFASGPLAQGLHLTGEPTLTLSGSLTGPGGHWIAVLFDVDEAGARDEVSRAYLDARHREGLESGQDVPPGPHDYTLRFFPRDHVVPAGHRLVLALLAGDTGCNSPGLPTDPAPTCEGTGIVPWQMPVTHVVDTGPGSATRLRLPLTDEPAGAWALTRLSGWLDAQPA